MMKMPIAAMSACVFMVLSAGGVQPDGMSPAEKFIRDNWKGTIRLNTKDEGEHVGLPLPYTCPCVSGAFQEMYYWDTYFTNVGLILSDMTEQAKNNCRNIAYLINKYGFMPNGNRTYYLGASQPPFFSRMVRDIYDATKDAKWIAEMYPALVKEHKFWQTRRVTKSGLNRYSGEFKDDAEKIYLAGYFFKRMNMKPVTEPKAAARWGETYRSYGESGWDCTSRFKYDPQDHDWVDLNSLLYGLESDLAFFAKTLGNGEEAKWLKCAADRKVLMERKMWDEQLGMFCDHNYLTDKKTSFVSVAQFYPLFTRLATKEQAAKTVKLLPQLEQRFGVACSQSKDLLDFQWDYPHGWACHQYIVINALLNYGYREDAIRIAKKYVTVVDKVFAETGALWEKYNVVKGEVSVTKEYVSPKMLGWSAGVYLFCRQLLGKADAATYTAKFMTDWKNPPTIKTTGRLVMPVPNNLNGHMFEGWKDNKTKKVYQPYEVVQLTEDAVFKPLHEKVDFARWTEGATEKPSKHKTGQGIIYAIGDSITYGTKVEGNKGAYPAHLAAKLGLEVVNDARAGSRLSQWRSVLTMAKNHNQYVDEHIQGVRRDQILDSLRRAGVVCFTLGSNDLLYNNKGDDVAYRLIEFVNALHHENPQALIVIVNGKNMEAFQKGGKYEANGEQQNIYADDCRKIFTGKVFKDYVLYVDISDLLAKHETYTNCERNPDGVHPGRDGQKAIAARILEYVELCANAEDEPKITPPPENEIPEPDPIAQVPSRAEMWNQADAGKAKTALREKISLNGLWAVKVDNAAKDLASAPSVDKMDYYLKVPGEWPSGTKNGMILWTDKGGDAFGTKVRKIDSLYYGRKVSIPKDWNGRMVKIGLQWVPTAVLVYVDGKKAGEVFFPGGEVDATKFLTPGEHDIQIFMSKAMQEKMVTAFDAPDTARSFSKKELEHPGINGDVYIAAEPKGVRVGDVQVRSHVAEGKIEFSLGFENDPEKVDGESRWTAVADIYDGAKKVKSIKSGAFTPKAAERFLFGGEWKDAKVWDLDVPENLYTVKVRLEANGKAVDELYAEEFGFRDVVLKGRDILLNGSPIHLRPRNSEYSRQDAVANEDMRIAMKDGKRMGFNGIVLTANYGFAEGDVTAFEVAAREVSKAGMTLVIGLPHPCHYSPPNKPFDWHLDGQYERLVRYMVKRFQNIPGLIFWSSTHNQTGYESDQNPAIISGKPDEIPTNIINWRARFRKLALQVNERMKVLDPTRSVYHHESGAEGEFYTLNCYLDWAPIQERSDWFEHWQNEGIMPLIIVEWGTPHIASWSSYRASPSGRNIWGERNSVQQCWLNEFNVALLGEKVFKTSPWKKITMDRIQNKKGNQPCYYGYHCDWGLVNEDDSSEVLSLFAKRNYKDMRARGVTSFLPWDIDGNMFFKPLADDKKKQKLRPDPFKGIKDFGVVKSDYVYEIFDQVDREPRSIAKTLMETYTDLLGWIAGPSAKEFTRVNDAFRIGEKVEKSLVILNDSRRERKIDYAWKAGSEKGKGSVTIKPGLRADIPISFEAASDTKEIVAGFKCQSTGWKSTDRFALNLLPAKSAAKVASKISVFDPEGGAKQLLKELGLKYVDAASSPRSGELLVVGRNALLKAPFDVLKAADAGVKVVILEQDGATLKKLGFRYQEHGLRNLFAAISEFASLDVTDWRGNATSLPEYLDEDKMKGDWATTDWEGFKNRRVWRAGNRGIVSCVIPEKPTKGDFMPVLHGGFDLQYAPVMEYSEPGKRVVLSQLDLCSRTEVAPEAVEALAKILEYADRPVANAKGDVLVLAGSKVSKEALDAVGIKYREVKAATDAKKGEILVVGPGASAGDLTALVKDGVKVLCLNLNGGEANRVYPAAKATQAKGNTYPDFNDDVAKEPLFRGISNADIQWNYPMCVDKLALFDGDKVLKAFHEGEGAIVFTSISQATFDEDEINLRHNRRRAQGLLTRLVANLGGAVGTGFLKQSVPLYADKPQQNDDPYRYYRW